MFSATLYCCLQHGRFFDMQTMRGVALDKTNKCALCSTARLGCFKEWLSIHSPTTVGASMAS